MPVHASRRIMDVVVLNDRIVCVAPEGFFVLADEAAIRAKGLVREGGE
ncbi:MAG: hypothetical protein IPK83_12290 [Planctomycetes bacterium]|nr:hypothetical protein [Planctomycetota bacterium]